MLIDRHGSISAARWRRARQPGRRLDREELARAPRKRELGLLGVVSLQPSGLLSATDEHVRASPPTILLGARFVSRSPEL